MAETPLTDVERRVLSYCSRGVGKASAEEKIGEFFQMGYLEVRPVLEKLKRQGLVIEAKGIAGIVVYQTSPIKVRSRMLDQQVVQQLTEMERGARAGGFKRKTFDPDTGAVGVQPAAQRKQQPAEPKGDLGFDLND